MGNVNQYKIVCSDCGYLFRYTDSAALAPSDEREPCPECEGTARTVLVALDATTDPSSVFVTERGEQHPDDS